MKLQHLLAIQNKPFQQYVLSVMFNAYYAYIFNANIEHIARLARMSVLDTGVDGSNPGDSMLFL